MSRPAVELFGKERKGENELTKKEEAINKLQNSDYYSKMTREEATNSLHSGLGNYSIILRPPSDMDPRPLEVDFMLSYASRTVEGAVYHFEWGISEEGGLRDISTHSATRELSSDGTRRRFEDVDKFLTWCNTLAVKPKPGGKCNIM